MRKDRCSAKIALPASKKGRQGCEQRHHAIAATVSKPILLKFQQAFLDQLSILTQDISISTEEDLIREGCCR